MQTHEQLKVWKKSITLCTSIYRLTEQFPREEIYGLTSQMRRAAVSVASNIAEGRRRGTDLDFRHFLHMAHGSLAELETQLSIALELGFCNSTIHDSIRVQTDEVGKMLHGMIKTLQ